MSSTQFSGSCYRVIKEVADTTQDSYRLLGLL